MNTRRMKVCYRPGADTWNVPQMRIGGLWLSKAGFNIGDPIELIVEENQIVIRHAASEKISNVVEESPEKYKR